MNRRKSGQKKGYLGHRSHGRGNCKNRRGSGNRGGRGMAGIDKHKWSWAMVYDKDHFHKHGFVSPTTKVRIKTTNLFELEQNALTEKLEKRAGKFHFDFEGKVLGNGAITHPIIIRAVAWSKNVEKKIQEAGGTISKLKNVTTTPTMPTT